VSEKKFSKEAAIKFGWNRMKDNLGFFIIYLILLFIIEAFFGFFASAFTELLPSLSILFNLGFWVVSVVSSIFVIKIGLKLYENEQIGSYDFLSFSSSLFFKFLLGYVLYTLLVVVGFLLLIVPDTLLVVVGFLLLIVPGIYLAIKYQYVQYLIVDKNMDVIEAFKESGKMTNGHKWNLLLLLLLFLMITILGVMALGVGLLVAAPIVMIAQAYVYKKLSLNTVVQTHNTTTHTGSIDNSFQAPGSIA
jgi:uncharacterized membrane protein